MKNTVAADRRRMKGVLRRLLRQFGPRPWRCWGRPLDVLVATILSQNTSDANSSAGYRQLRRRFRTWSAAADAPVSEIERCIRVSGLSRIKAPRIRAILRELRRSRGQVSMDYLRDMAPPEAYAHLRRFKGVGAKTASCVLLFSLREPWLPVDTHIVRIACRLGLVKPGTSPDRCQELLTPLVAPGDRYAMHVLLIELGRTVCKARGPRCEWCDLGPMCPGDRSPAHGGRRRDCAVPQARRQIARPHNG